MEGSLGRVFLSLRARNTIRSYDNGASHGKRTGSPYILAQRCSKARTETRSLSSTAHAFTGLSVSTRALPLFPAGLFILPVASRLYISLYLTIHTCTSTLIVISAACSRRRTNNTQSAELWPQSTSISSKLDCLGPPAYIHGRTATLAQSLAYFSVQGGGLA